MSDIPGRVEVVEEQIVRIAESCGRLPSEIELIAVSKSQSAETVREALDAGQLRFGENRAQELIVKVPLLPSSIHWHFIGHLQKTRSARYYPWLTLSTVLIQWNWHWISIELLPSLGSFLASCWR